MDKLKAPVCRVCLPDTPAPASRSLEENYFITEDRIMQAVLDILGKK
jgi:pyruvate/2-oxoglutarate/acetoin dehydrogenase E1 component